MFSKKQNSGIQLEINRSGREGFLKLLTCKLLHFKWMRNVLERATWIKRMMFDTNRTERFVRDRIVVTLACITPT